MKEEIMTATAFQAPVAPSGLISVPPWDTGVGAVPVLTISPIGASA